MFPKIMSKKHQQMNSLLFTFEYLPVSLSTSAFFVKENNIKYTLLNR